MKKDMKGIKDGYDLGILIRMDIWKELPISRIYNELISEVGWLHGGEEDLKERLKRLEKHGYLEEDKEKSKNFCNEVWYGITSKGENLFKEESSKIEGVCDKE